MRYLFSVLACVGLCLLTIGCGSRDSADFAFIDRYLATWDKFAQGANNLLPQVKTDAPAFQRQLAAALRKKDPRGPSRFVFYAIVQVGGFVPAESELGQAFRHAVDDAVPVFVSEKDGSRSYFAGDLYFWWEAQKSNYPAFPLYEDWRQRDFARNVVIKMYEGAVRNRK